jgi:hypothetical protein
MCFSCELYALRLHCDEEKWLSNGFAKKEEIDHEPVETPSAAVPHCLCSTGHLDSQVHDLDPFSYQDHSSGVLLCHTCTVSYMVHCFMHRWTPEIVGKGRWRRRTCLVVDVVGQQ